MSDTLTNAVFTPSDYVEVYHNGTNLIGLKNSDLLSLSLSAAVTSAPRKTFKQLSGSDQVIPSNFFGQHSTTAGIPNWTGKLLKIGDLALNWMNVSPAGSLAVTFSGQNVTWNTHGRAVGTPVVFFAPADGTVATAGVLPTGITADTVYYVASAPDGNTIQVSATLGGAAITFSGSPTNVGVLALDSAKMASLDAIIDAAAVAGKNLVYQGHATPAWASVDGASTNKRAKSYKPFATYIKVLYGRVTASGNAYSSVLKYIEGWNEPNTVNSFSGTQSSAGGRSTITFTANTGTVPVSWTAHGFPIGAAVQAENFTGTLPAELVEGTPYYVCRTNYSANQFALTTTWTEDGSGTPINFAATGTGQWKITGCDLTTHQAWVYKAAKNANAAISVLSPAYTGAPGITGAVGQTLTGYRGVRANSTRYELGEAVYLTATDNKVHFYRVSTAGTTAASIAVYAGTSAEAITDGTAVLTECSISTSSLAGWLITNGAIAGAFVDKIAFHTYQGSIDFFAFDWHSVDAVMMARTAYGLTAKDVWCTEFGFSSPAAASDLYRTYLYSIGAGLTAFIYYNWDTSTGTGSGLTSMRLVDGAYSATYNTIAAWAGATVNYVNVNYYTGVIGASINGASSVY